MMKVSNLQNVSITSLDVRGWGDYIFADELQTAEGYVILDQEGVV
jgi:hypothetical protein